MSTRSECVTIDFVMESAAITKKQQAVAPNNAPANEPKSRGHNPEGGKLMLWIGAIAHSRKCPLRGYIRCTHLVRRGALP